MPNNPFRLFCRAFFKHWWELMGSAVFTVLAVVLADIPDPAVGNVWLVRSSIVFAFFFFAVASYRTWKEEHDKYESELGRNALPEISGSFSNLNFANSEAHYEFDLVVCNHTKAVTNIRDVFLHLSYSDGESQTIRATLFPSGSTARLDFGIEQHFRALLVCPRSLFVSGVKARLTDGLGKEHIIPYQGSQPMNIGVEREVPITPIIYLAKWGMSWFRSHRVTGELRGYFQAGIEPTASTQCLGDPYFRKNKYLRVKASIDNGRTRKWYTFREGDPVRFSSLKVAQ